MAFTTIRNFISKITRRRRAFVFLPQEILDLIISSLRDDKASLLSCALVHPTWTGIGRYHLRHHTLVVSSPSRGTELTELLRLPHETLSPSITSIMLVGSVPYNGISRNFTSPSVTSYSELLRVLKAKGIVLRSGAVEEESTLIRVLEHYFPDLTNLKVRASYLDITSCMRVLSGTFPRLAELTIELDSVGLDVSDVALLFGLRHLRLAKPCLRTLRVVGWNNELVRWLGDNIVGTLECLELKSFASAQSTRCRFGEGITLIQRNKNPLRDLRLTFRKCDVGFDLSGLRLKNLEVASTMCQAELAANGWRFPRLKRV